MGLLSERWRNEARYLRKEIPGHGRESVARLDACARWLDSCADEYDMEEAPDWLGELISALGWQGGTIHQAIDAVKRLCNSNNGVDQIKEEIKRRVDVTNSLPEQQLALKSMLEWMKKTM